MTSPPRLFDPDLLARRRLRAARLGPVDFLHDAVAAEITERLAEINRSFRAPAVIGPRAKLYADAFAQAGLGDAHCVADAETLDLREGAHDLVVHALALHWANDPVGQLVQARRALMPDGLFMGAAFGGETLGALRAAFAEAEVETTGGLSPRVAPMSEIRDLGGLLQRAHLALPVCDSVRFDVTYATPMQLMHELRAMGETNVMRDRSRVPLRRATLARMCEIYAAHFGTEDGRVTAMFEIVFLTGWGPAPDQPQPLRPGSATARLADAFGTEERPAGEKTGR